MLLYNEDSWTFTSWLCIVTVIFFVVNVECKGSYENKSDLTSTWSLKLKTVSPDKAINDEKAFHLASSLGMESLGQVGELNGHYIFKHHKDTPIDSKTFLLSKVGLAL